MSLDPRKPMFSLQCKSFHMCPPQNCRSLRDLSSILVLFSEGKPWLHGLFILKLKWGKCPGGCPVKQTLNKQEGNTLVTEENNVYRLKARADGLWNGERKWDQGWM